MSSAAEFTALLARIEKKLDAIGEVVDRLAASKPVPAPAANNGACFPNYGRSKGAAITGASMQDLEFYANGARRSLADPSKARFHAKERALLDAIEAEIARQTGKPNAPAPDFGTGDDSSDCPF